MATFKIPTLTSERLILRAPGARDEAVLAAFYASERSRFVGGPKSPAQSWRQLAAEIGHWALRGYGRWMIDLDLTGETVGMVGLWNPVGWPEPEIGWDLMNGHEGHGYATEAALTARAYAYDILGWQTAISLVNPENTGSAAVAARLGATREGPVQLEGYDARVDVYRHPSPEDLVNGGMDAYA